MRRTRSLLLRSGLCLLCPAAVFPATAQQSATTTAPRLSVLSYTAYPSMTPILAVRVQLSQTTQMKELIDQAIADKKQPWNCADTSSYVVTDTPADTTAPSHAVPIQSLRREPNYDCAVGIQEPAIILVLNSHSIAAGDKLTVSLAKLPAPLTASPSAAVAVPKPSNSFALTITPQAAPNEALTTGSKRDVGQLSIAYTEPDIAPHFALGAVYLTSNDLFSTDERDSKSAFAGTVGIKRGLARNWYLPLSLQETIQGNQVASNLGSVTSLNFASILPWSWNKTFLYNGAIQAPNPPEVTIAAAYTARIHQNVTEATPLLASNDFTLNPSATFSPIYLLPSACRWLQGKLGKEDAAAVKSKQYCLGLQTDVGMWYLPLDLTKSQSQRAEGYGDVSILIPLSDIPFVSKSLSSLITGNTSNNQLRIKYSDSINAANNYARTRQWTYGFEVIK